MGILEGCFGISLGVGDMRFESPRRMRRYSKRLFLIHGSSRGNWLEEHEVEEHEDFDFVRAKKMLIAVLSQDGFLLTESFKEKGRFKQTKTLRGRINFYSYEPENEEVFMALETNVGCGIEECPYKKVQTYFYCVDDHFFLVSDLVRRNNTLWDEFFVKANRFYVRKWPRILQERREEIYCKNKD